MSRIAELAAKIAADKTRSDELEAAMAGTDDIADQLAGSFTSIGAAGKAEQIQAVKTQLGQARNTRWLAEGHLEDALTVLQAVMDGQRSGGTGSGDSPSASPSSSASDSATEPEGGHTFTTDIDGQPVQVTIIPPQPEQEPGPSGETLVEEASERRGRFSRSSRTALRKLDDLTDGAKKLTNTQYDAARALKPPGMCEGSICEKVSNYASEVSPGSEGPDGAARARPAR